MVRRATRPVRRAGSRPAKRVSRVGRQSRESRNFKFTEGLSAAQIAALKQQRTTVIPLLRWTDQVLALASSVITRTDIDSETKLAIISSYVGNVRDNIANDLVVLRRFTVSNSPSPARVAAPLPPAAPALRRQESAEQVGRFLRYRQ